MRDFALIIKYVSGGLRQSAEILLESVIWYGRDGSVMRIPPSARGLEATTTIALLGALVAVPFR